ncbi:hypothetical protein HNV08_13520 [Winogradskyella eckloniae]|uniref:hypothetical protein n=1 Tax=Winogradskyella eckloniae TaxID=1089306 RepID=UPI001566B558|nr:hypothetical protein [Winogradskyella eckloniae]NRD21071.1 hypothetical protein [Winogradskyella eckloniae]
MIQAQHCNLCKFPEMDLKVGLTCGLTHKKPKFKSRCPDLQFSSIMTEQVTNVCHEIEKLNKTKSYIYFNFVLLNALGLLILIIAYYELKNTLKLDFSYIGYKHFNIYYTFYFLGTTSMSLACYKLIVFRKTKKRLEIEKHKLASILKTYNLSINSVIRSQ